MKPALLKKTSHFPRQPAEKQKERRVRGGGGGVGGLAENATAYHTESQIEIKQLIFSSLFSFFIYISAFIRYKQVQAHRHMLNVFSVRLNHDFNFIYPHTY